MRCLVLDLVQLELRVPFKITPNVIDKDLGVPKVFWKKVLKLDHKIEVALL